MLIRVAPRRRFLFGLRPKRIGLRLVAGVVKGQQPLLTVTKELTVRPLFGPKQMLALLAICFAGLISSALVAVSTALLALWPAPAAEVVSQTVASPPVVAIVLNLNQPVPTTAQPATPIAASVAEPSARVLGEQSPVLAQADPALPIIRLDQVSTPGAPPPASEPLITQRATTSNLPSANMTYQQLFQEAALRYDLNWRMLAAQAYVESSFDTLALGNSGAMGLMQIMPPTWREWAPVVDAVDPFDAYSSVWVAAAYLDFLRSKLGAKGYPQQEWMLVAYNWGLDKVNDHLEAGLGWEELPAESRQYALDVLRIAETIRSN